jgi:hypothetical protein
MRGFNQAVLVLFVSSMIGCGGKLVNFGDAAGASPDGGVGIMNPPTVTPTTLASGVCTNKALVASFSEAMDPATINSTTFKVAAGTSATSVAGTVTYDTAKKAATFTPAPDFAPNTAFTATIGRGARSQTGNALASDFAWSFSTSLCGCQSPVSLGAASGFAVLAGSTVTSTNATTITGNLGVSPGTAVTGFPPGTLNGSQYTGVGSAAGQAKADLTTAFDDAAARTCVITVAGNLGGSTLTPGLYKSTSTLAISSGDLTLDAQGDPNAVFIFQMASSFTSTAGRKVILSGGAKATNVFWQVGSSATLGTGSDMKGTVLAQASISVTSGATLEGRALTQTGQVTMDANTVSMPAQ